MDLVALALAKKYTDGTLAGLGSLQGKDGKSAYQIALDNGFIGTETAWLESLKGERGTDGINGIDGQDGADGIGISNVVINSDGELVLTYTNGESTNLGKVVGADGTNGTDGKDGTNGTNGVGIKTVTLSTDGELSILLTDNTVCNLGNIKGEKGDKGDKGDTGEQGEKGIQGIQGEKGEQGQSGTDGKSAYEIALEHGFIGSEDKWLASLKGSDYILTDADKTDIANIVINEYDSSIMAILGGDNDVSE